MSFEHKPTLILFCGLPGSGKTTLARRLSEETGAVRLCPDEWMADLGLDLFDEALREKLEVRLWRLGQEVLKLGQDVILENGLWSRSERDDKRRDVEHLDVVTEMHYFNVPVEELMRRLAVRNVSGGHGTVPITPEQIQEYAGLFEAPDANELALFDRQFTYSGGF